MKNILIINDFVSKGKIAGNMMDPVLTYKNFNTYFLPSALISNNFSYGKVAILDTYDYMREAFRIWDELEFVFDVIFIGYVEDSRQKDLIINYIKSRTNNPTVILDPIMGDNGTLYKGVDEAKIDNYKEILEVADIIIPNHTEAKFLGLNDPEALLETGKKFVITSVADGNFHYNLIVHNTIEKVHFEKEDIYLTGTGDLFDALFIAYYTASGDFKKAVVEASDKIVEIIKIQSENHPGINDIYIESYLGLLD